MIYYTHKINVLCSCCTAPFLFTKNSISFFFQICRALPLVTFVDPNAMTLVALAKSFLGKFPGMLINCTSLLSHKILWELVAQLSAPSRRPSELQQWRPRRTLCDYVTPPWLNNYDQTAISQLNKFNFHTSSTDGWDERRVAILHLCSTAALKLDANSPHYPRSNPLTASPCRIIAARYQGPRKWCPGLELPLMSLNGFE